MRFFACIIFFIFLTTEAFSEPIETETDAKESLLTDEDKENIQRILSWFEVKQKQLEDLKYINSPTLDEDVLKAEQEAFEAQISTSNAVYNHETGVDIYKEVALIALTAILIVMINEKRKKAKVPVL